VIVLRRSGLSIDANPRPSEIVLVVEVSDASLRQDLTAKARLYARAGIPEYWVLDVNNRRLHVLRAPREGTYQERFELTENESVSPKERPGDKIAVAALLS
jgi:Uma2 family endonuclease